jgi:hypothetical protein
MNCLEKILSLVYPLASQNFHQAFMVKHLINHNMHDLFLLKVQYIAAN